MVVWRAEFSARLKEVRQALTWTVDQFAEVQGVSKRTQTAYENGERVPDAEYLFRLAHSLHVDVAYLLTGEPLAKTIYTKAVAQHPFLRHYENLQPRRRRVVDEVMLLATMAETARLTREERGLPDEEKGEGSSPR